jgi:hypothetical protein
MSAGRSTSVAGLFDYFMWHDNGEVRCEEENRPKNERASIIIISMISAGKDIRCRS